MIIFWTKIGDSGHSELWPVNICESNADDLIKKKAATETFLWPWFLFSAFVFCSFPTILRSIATELIHYVTKKEAGVGFIYTFWYSLSSTYQFNSRIGVLVHSSFAND